MTPPQSYDVVVVGAGVVGTAIARELARYPVRTVMVDAELDVGNGTSKANTAILHTGFDAVPGSLESTLVRRGYALLREFAASTGIAVEQTGALLVAWDDEQMGALPGLADKAVANGYLRTRPVDLAELRAREPHLGSGARGALEIPDESIICPWSTTIAFATQAVRSGVTLRLGTTVRSVSADRRSTDERHLIRTGQGDLSCRYLVNAAGLGADLIDRQLGIDDFSITPRRGQLIVFDKLARSLVSQILLPVPTGRTKGVLVAPTVYGNVLLGPTAEDLRDRTDTASTRDGLEALLGNGSRIIPDLVREEVTAVYAGLRAATEHADYQIRAHPKLRYVTVGGIRSTGLTASMAIAEYVVNLLVESGLGLGQARELAPVRVPYLGESGPRPYQQPDLIAADPAFGTIVCHCERVTRGEIDAAMHSEIKPRTLDGLRRRTRALNGRCQGFACGAAVRGLFESGRQS